MISLLWPDFEKNRQNGSVESQAFFQDLNMDQIISRVTEDWGEEVLALYRELPSDQETE